jgi:mannose-6-phosphate isomerase-like protein (cupin superfamily)
MVTLVNLPPGTYRCRITREGFIPLDKEVTIRPGVRITSEGILNVAPAPPPPPAPPPAVTKPAPPTAPTLKPGPASTTSLVDIVPQLEKELRNAPTAERDLGCSGATASRLIMTRENIAVHDHAEADEMLYVIAGEGSVTIGSKEQAISPAWFSVVPRGMSHSLTKKGRNALLVLSVRSGPVCPGL